MTISCDLVWWFSRVLLGREETGVGDILALTEWPCPFKHQSVVRLCSVSVVACSTSGTLSVYNASGC